MYRQAHRAPVIHDRRLHGLANPPDCVRRKTQTPRRIEFFDRANQAEISLGDQIHQQNAATDVGPRDGHDQPQIRFDQASARFGIAGLHAFGERPFRGRVEQRDQADFTEIGAGRVARLLILRFDRVDQVEDFFRRGIRLVGNGGAHPRSLALSTPWQIVGRIGRLAILADLEMQ